VFFIGGSIVKKNNEVRLVGNVVKAPKIFEKETGNFGVVRMAVNTKRGEREETLYIDVKLFGYTFNDLGYYDIDKGDRVQVDGRLVMEEFTNKEGVDVTVPAIIADNVVKFYKKAKESASF
jgi:single-stranded DNA-binding protein